MNNLNYQRKKKITIIAIITIMLVRSILLALVFETNLGNEVLATMEETDTRTHQTTVPEGYTPITNASELAIISSNLTGNYILMSDIYLTGVTNFDVIGTSSTESFRGILDGNNYKISNLNIESENQYVGLFGYVNGGTVKDLTIENASVKSIYTTNTTYVGTLAGYTTNTTIENISITGEGKVEAIDGTKTKYIGGLIGYINEGTISDSNSSVDILAQNGPINAGGLIGYVCTGIAGSGTEYMNISNVYATGNVNSNSTGTQYVGGLIGRGLGNYNSSRKSNYLINLNHAYATGNVETNSTNGAIYVGGFIGDFANGTLSTSYATGSVVTTSDSGAIYVGGLIGKAYINGNSAGTKIENAYSLAKVKTKTNGKQNVGGLIGEATGYYESVGTNLCTAVQIINTYAVGKVEAQGSGTKNIGGLVGYIGSYTWNGGTKPSILGKATNSYWSPEITEQRTSADGTPRLLHNMIHEALYENWDFESVWEIKENAGSLPYFKDMAKPEGVNKENYKYQVYDEGKGTEEFPYIIKTEEQLQAIKYDVNGTYYKLGNDIEIRNIANFEPIGNTEYPFMGTVDGANFTIRNLNIESEGQYVGLFGYIDKGTIKNLTLENAKVKSTYTYANSSSTYAGNIGVLAGYINNGTIENVLVVGESKVEAIAEVNLTNIGGLVGYTNNGIISKSSSNTEIIASSTTGAINAGGLVGYEYRTTTTESNATGNIEINSESGEVNAGGLIGYAYTGYNETKNGNGNMNITDTYATGNVTSNSNGIQSVGGLIGKGAGTRNYNNGSSYLINVNNTYATGIVEATSTNKAIYAGGLIGSFESGKVTISYSAGNVVTTSDSGAVYAGGLIGKAFGGSTSVSTPFNTEIENAYSLTGVKTKTNGTQNVGGLIGEATGYYQSVGTNSYAEVRVINTYAVGKIETQGSGTKNTGGLVGYIGSYQWNGATKPYKLATVTNSYWSPKTTGQETTSEGQGEAKTIQELLYRSGYSDVWDFDNIWTIEPNGGSLAYFGKLPRPDGVLVENLPYDSRISVNKTDENGNPLSGAKFVVKDETGAVVAQGSSNNSGIFYIFDLEEGTYTLQETEAPDSYIKDDSKYEFRLTADGRVVDVVTGNPININVVNEKIKGSITITKKKTGTDISILGAKIGIFSEDGTKVAEAATGEDGTVTFADLEPGDYYYKEIEAPAGYVLNNTEYHFTVENSGEITLANGSNKIIYNNRVTMKEEEAFTITKKKTGTEIVLQGATIGVFDESGNEIGKGKTNEQGQVGVRDLEVGRYYYKEIEAPLGYVLNDTKYYFTVENDGTVTFDEETTKTIYNDRVTMKEDETFTITKKRKGTETVLQGAKIGIFDEDGTKVAEAITGENGTITVRDLEVGRYYYQEVEAPAGYVLNNIKYYFTVENDGTVTFDEESNKVIYNDRVTTKEVLTITKKKTGTEIVLSGAKIGVFVEDGTKVKEATTGENGTVTFSDLEPGSYYYKEIEAPAGYVLNSTEYHFTVENSGEVTLANGSNKIIYNNRVTMKEDEAFTITKKITGTETVLKGSTIGIFDERGNEIGKGKTNEQGQVGVSGLEVGRYYYKEIEAPAGYILNDTKYYFTVENDGTVTFDEESNKVIYNDRITTKEVLTIVKKKTGTDISISGAKIGIFVEDGTKVAEATTREDGTVTFADLKPGEYYYKEIEAPAGYVLNDTKYYFTIGNDGEITLANGSNKIIYNNRVTMKEDEAFTVTKQRAGTEMVLAGAKIGIFDANGNKVTEATTGEDGTITVRDLEVGRYYYQEIEAPAGYVLNATKYYFEVKNDGTVNFKEGTNKIIYNEKMKVDVSIYKMEKGTRKLLSGAVIGLYDKDGNPVLRNGEHIKVITNAEGEAIFTELEVGEIYQYKEELAPMGYRLNESLATFRINEEGRITYAENGGIIYNEKILVQQPSTSQDRLPQTGETEINTIVLGTIMILTGISMAGTVYYKRKIK